MNNKGAKNVASAFLIGMLISGCAPGWIPYPVPDSYYLSEHFNNAIRPKISVFPIIDARKDKDIKIVNISSYETYFKLYVVQTLREKNYNIVNVNYDTSYFPSVSEISDNDNLFNDKFKNKIDTDLVLLISIDSYKPISGDKDKATPLNSGGLYSMEMKSFIWRYSVQYDSDPAEVARFFGPFAYTYHTIDRALHPEKDYIAVSFSGVLRLLSFFPPYIESNDYYRQLKENRL